MSGLSVGCIGMSILLGVSAPVLGGTTAATELDPDLRITVNVYNYAEVPDGTLADAKRLDYPSALVLGHVIAHEIGHLLMGRDSHSRTGLMSFPMRKKLLELAAKRQLRFRPPEGRRFKSCRPD